MNPASFPSRGAGRTLAALALLVVAGAWQTVAAQDLPEADRLIDRYVEAIGGEEAHTRSAMRMEGTMAIPAMGIEGTFELLQAPPDRLVMTVEIPGLGRSLQGFDGQTAWSDNPMTGPALASGAELEQMREQSAVRASVRDPALIPERETLERTAYEGRECWKVRLVWASGRESTDCYGVDDGLLLASETTQASAMGEMQTVSLYLDYEEFDGRLVPTRLVQRVMGQEQVLTVREVEYGPIPEERFELPPAIRTLLEGEPGA
jgi:hypothetical protein